MLIDNIDFSDLYQQQLALARRTNKTAAHWDQRAPKMAAHCANPNNTYLQQFISAIDFTDASSVLDVGCGTGNLCLELAKKLHQVWGIDYSPGMLEIAGQQAREQHADNITLRQCAWEDDWSQLPRCDIAIASRSTLVADLRQAMYKLNQQARLRIYTTHPLNTTFVDKAIQQAIGREIQEVPNYIYAVNILYQMGIHASVSFIYSAARQPEETPDFTRFADSVSWALGGLTDDEQQRLFDYYQRCQRQAQPLPITKRDWALIHWQHQPLAKR